MENKELKELILKEESDLFVSVSTLSCQIAQCMEALEKARETGSDEDVHDAYLRMESLMGATKEHLFEIATYLVRRSAGLLTVLGL